MPRDYEQAMAILCSVRKGASLGSGPVELCVSVRGSLAEEGHRPYGDASARPTDPLACTNRVLEVYVGRPEESDC